MQELNDAPPPCLRGVLPVHQCGWNANTARGIHSKRMGKSCTPRQDSEQEGSASEEGPSRLDLDSPPRSLPREEWRPLPFGEEAERTEAWHTLNNYGFVGLTS